MKVPALPIAVIAIAIVMFLAPFGGGEAAAKEMDGDVRRITEEILLAGDSVPLKKRMRALRMLRTVEGPIGRLRLALAKTLDDPNPELRRAVLELVRARRGHGMASFVLRGLERETSVELIPSYLLAFGATANASRASSITSYVTHSVPAVRAAALTALADMGAEDARRLALHVLRDPRDPDPGWVLRSSALLALAKCGDPEDLLRIQSIVRARSGSKHWLARSAMVNVIAALHAQPARELLPYAHDGDHRVALTAMRALMRAGGLPALRPLLKHGVATTRAAAVRAVIPTRDGEFLAQVKRMAKRDPSRVVRWTAATSLFRAREREADELVIDGLRSEEPAIWSEALSLLMSRTGESHGRDAKAWKRVLAARRAASSQPTRVRNER